MYIPKTDDCLKLLTDYKVKDFVAIHFSEYFKSISEEPSLRKAAKSLRIFLTTPHEVENMCSQIYLIVVYITITLKF